MASFYTHTKAYSDSKDLLSEKTLNSLPNFADNKLLLGHDTLLYPACKNYIFNKNASQELCLIIGHSNFPEFVAHFIKHAKNNGSIEEENIRLYLYGYISHHIVDAYLHPIITHYSGGADTYLPTKEQRRWMHGIIEVLVDAYLIKNYEQTNPKRFKKHKNLTFKGQISPKLRETLNSAALSTYDVPDVGTKLLTVINPLNKLNFYLRIFQNDPFGWKVRFYNFVDDKTQAGCSFFSNHVDYRDAEAYLNKQNEEWTNPFDLSISSKKSLLELLREAVVEIARIVDTLEEINHQSTHNCDEIKQVVPNISAITGLEGGTPMTVLRDRCKILLP